MDTPKEISARIDILQEAAFLTSNDRDHAYGEPIHNFSCIGALQKLYHDHYIKSVMRGGREISAAEMSVINLIIVKLARLLGAARRDTYVDGAAYFAVAGEIAEIMSKNEPK